MRPTNTILSAAVLAITLGGCATTETAFSVPQDCQQAPMPSPADSPWEVPSGRTMSADCMKRIEDSRSSDAPR